VDFAKRAARNEEIFRGVNERIDEGAAQHDVHTALPFHCECGRTACFDTIELPPPAYERVAGKRSCFIVVPGHEQPQIERIIEHRTDYLVVEKTGEARRQIDRDHPQQQHR
jgi:hypothetical protein